MENLNKILATVPLINKASPKSRVKIHLLPSLKSVQAVASLKFRGKLSQFCGRLFQIIRFKNSCSKIKNMYKTSFKEKALATVFGSLSLET